MIIQNNDHTKADVVGLLINIDQENLNRKELQVKLKGGSIHNHDYSINLLKTMIIAGHTCSIFPQ